MERARGRDVGRKSPAKPTRPFPPLALPKQARSRQKLAEVLAAAETEIAERGFENASISRIMKRAGSAVGSFYLRFQSKDHLLYALLDRFVLESVETTNRVLTAERLVGRSISQIAEELIPLIVSVYRRRRGLIRAILLRGSVDPVFNQLAYESERFIAESLEKLFVDRSAEIGREEPALAGRFAYQMVRGVLNSLALFELRDRAGLSLDDPRLELELTRGFLAILEVNSVATDTAPKRTKQTSR